MGVDDRPGRSDNRESHLLGTERIQRAARMGGRRPCAAPFMEYKTAAFVWVKKNRKSDTPFWGMGAYTRANAEICLLGVTPDFRASEQIKSHAVHQIIEAPVMEHSIKPDETRRRIVELLGDVPRIELFARQRVPGWDAWGDEIGD